MIERLLEFMKMKNLTSSALADSLGIQRSGISHFVSGRNKPSLEFILKILNHYPEINPDWMLFGHGEVFRDGKSGTIQESVNGDKLTASQVSAESSGLTQPSLLDELFENTGETDGNEVNSSTFIPYGKSEKQAAAKKKEIKEEAASTENQVPAARKGKAQASPERIILLFNDKSFREYFPDQS